MVALFCDTEILLKNICLSDARLYCLGVTMFYVSPGPGIHNDILTSSMPNIIFHQPVCYDIKCQ